MRLIRRILLFVAVIITISTFSGCAVGMLLFYKESETSTVYKSSKSKKNYFIIYARSQNHCGCTSLFVKNYKAGKKEFTISYNNGFARKRIYTFDKNTDQRDTIRLIATANNNFTTAFDSLDVAIFNQIDSLAIHKPKGIVYGINKTSFKGFIKDGY